MQISDSKTKTVLGYLDFVDLRDSLRRKCKLTTKECLLLRVITRHHLNKETLRVKQLMDMDFIASPATIHGIIQKLVSKKMVNIKVDATDARVKHVLPSDKAIDLFAELGTLVKS